MEVNIFLLPLLGGYIFIKTSKLFRYKSIRYDSQELIFSSAVTGLLGVTVAFILSIIFSQMLPDLSNTMKWWTPYIGEKFFGTSLLSFLLLILVAFVPNYWIDDEKIINKVINDNNDAMELIFLKSLNNAKLVNITLKSRKFYIGFVSQNFFNPSSEVKSIMIVPVYSGFRHEEDFKLNVTTIYDAVFESQIENDLENDLDDLQYAIPVNEILTVNIFDVDVYEKFVN